MGATGGEDADLGLEQRESDLGCVGGCGRGTAQAQKKNLKTLKKGALWLRLDD